MKNGKDCESMSVYEQVREGLKESLAAARRELTLKSTNVTAPAPKVIKNRVSAANADHKLAHPKTAKQPRRRAG
jgi:hypothetical protein